MFSIRSRILFSSFVALLLFMTLTVVLLDREVQNTITRTEREKITSRMYGILGAVDKDANGTSIVVSDARLFINELFNADSGLYAQVYDRSNREIWRSLSTQNDFPAPVDLNEEQLRFQRIQFAGEHWFQLAFSFKWPDIYEQLHEYRIVLWQLTDRYDAFISKFRQILWVWFGFTLLLLLVIMGWVIHWNLRPLRKIGEEVDLIEKGKRRRLDNHYPREIIPLTRNLNRLLKRDQLQVKRYRNALDDLAHSLKTPLSVLRGYSESTDHGKQQDTIAQQVERMNQIISHQLGKSVTLRGSAMLAPVNLTPILEKTCAALRKVYPETRIELELSTHCSHQARIDEGDLYELFGNLIENACKYGKQRVRVGSHCDGDQQPFLITIEDDGNGLSAEQWKKLIQRGNRLDESREGQGIGLAIVRDIVFSGEIEVSTDQSELGGLRISLQFPVL